MKKNFDEIGKMVGWMNVMNMRNQRIRGGISGEEEKKEVRGRQA